MKKNNNKVENNVVVANTEAVPVVSKKAAAKLFKMMEGEIKAGKKVTLSDQMRFLQAQGLTVGEIAKIVDRPYRQVYSTLNHHKYIGGVMERKAAKQAKKDQEMEELRAKVEELEKKLARRAAK
ncbi:MAG: hypothetical protein WCR71_05795 [Bacteroidales bacterium]